MRVKQILCIPTQDFLDSDQTITSFIPIIKEKGVWIERAKAETDETYLQIIPYLAIKKDNTFFTYERLNKGNEDRLHGKLSIGIGGHIDFLEINKNINHAKQVLEGATRELREETIITMDQKEIDYDEYAIILDSALFGCLIYDPSNAVGRVHLGVLMFIDLTGSDLEVSIRETEKMVGSFVECLEIDKTRLEGWSVIALEALLDDDGDFVE